MDQYVLLALVLALVGFALITAELFIPSGGMISILCIVSFVVSLWFAYKGWWVTSPGYFWTFASALFVGVPVFVLFLFRLVETTSLGDRILLAAPTSEEVTPYQEEQQRLSQLIGKRGRAMTMLNPGGLVRVDGQRLHAFSEGIVIDPEEAIEVLEVRGPRVLVRRVSPVDIELSKKASTNPTDDSSSNVISSESVEPLDFDLPQS